MWGNPAPIKKRCYGGALHLKDVRFLVNSGRQHIEEPSSGPMDFGLRVLIARLIIVIIPAILLAAIIKVVILVIVTMIIRRLNLHGSHCSTPRTPSLAAGHGATCMNFTVAHLEMSL